MDRRPPRLRPSGPSSEPADPRPGSSARHDAGAASVEHAGLVLLVALALLAAISSFAAGGGDRSARELGTALTQKIRCAARLSDTCWRDPLTDAYGRSVAGLVRSLAPPPVTVSSGSGPLLPVDFRRCRSVSCSLPGPRSPALTASNRRTSAFVHVIDERGSSGDVTLTYWLYRPTLGWESVVRRATSEQVEAAAATPLLDSDVPVLVPLETLPGRNHFRFAEGEEPPWRWEVVG
ncbi:MAG: hypothetical protein H0W09_03680 [Solirubrobacterales bacterium]|nr:hypothetical protein [Solirubrobacterales bacterium]